MSILYIIPATAVGFLILTDPVSVILTLAGFAVAYALLLWLASIVLGEKR